MALGSPSQFYLNKGISFGFPQRLVPRLGKPARRPGIPSADPQHVYKRMRDMFFGRKTSEEQLTPQVIFLFFWTSDNIM